MHHLRKHAVVCGASMAGLLAARVLADFYESVTVVERDILPDNAIQRRGVAHGRHLQMMLSGGSSRLAHLFPGLFDELAAAGAHVMDGIDDPSLFYLRVGEHVACRSGRFTRSDDVVIVLASRPLLETHVRRRVSAFGNVTIMDSHDVIEPVLDSSCRISAARVADRETGAERMLEADLVVDATGRAGRTPAFLEARGYERPRERKYPVGLSYSSQFFRLPSGALTEKVAAVNDLVEKRRGAGVLAYEDGTAILTLIGVAGHKLPTDLPGVLDAATELLPPQFSSALRAAQPLGAVTAQHYPVSVWRRYDKLDRLPQGLLVIGDAVCSFNPVYGQGMTSAALQAMALRQCLSSADTTDIATRYFRTAAKKLAPIWWANRFTDFNFTPTDDWRTKPRRLLNRGMDRVWAALATDIVLAETFIRKLQLVDPPTAMLQPAMLRRLLAGGRVSPVR
ncbi:hypothetical protein AFM11_04225 [Mycolicibacterium wolinskyi]|uniref:FAD-binding domain-containing protein n=1 Tax=Mycolicibacterium wolinskyi TaxID=59750 RepID=A0A132PSZ2_9MYCO|nr:FAD-dependent monooxygenase [Mycolicibacterium wolinskyi]KWX25468.1 hypothetical protein AFM11_04225 [Mycolicibacterium wolinskyi]